MMPSLSYAQLDPTLTAMILEYTQKAKSQYNSQLEVMAVETEGHVWLKQEVEATKNYQQQFDRYISTFRGIISYAAQVYAKKGIKLQAFDTCDDVKDYIIRKERKIQKVRTRKRKNYRFGRYDFVIIRKRLALEILPFYEQHPSFWQRQGMRWRIFWKNLLSSYERITYLPQE